MQFLSLEVPEIQEGGGVNQSINQSNPQSATRAQEKPHPSATTRAANPATQSVAGLGGEERVAQALACATRSMFTRFLQKRAKRCLSLCIDEAARVYPIRVRVYEEALVLSVQGTRLRLGGIYRG